MRTTKIEWTESTWNPVTGCSKMSLGCQNCYAEKMAKRLKAMGQANYKNGFKLTLHPDVLEYPLKWKKSKIIFVNSMSDLFHEDIHISYIQKIFTIMNNTPQHTYQVLTKRSERLVEIANELKWTDNIWMGVTIEHQQYAYRAEQLKLIPAKTKFLSLEPLLSDIFIEYRGIDWVIVGGESGINSRPILEDWVINIKNQCDECQVPFFFKQWGGFNKKKAGRLLFGKTWDAMPVY